MGGGPISAMEFGVVKDVEAERPPAEVLPPTSFGEAFGANWRLSQDDEQDYRFQHQLEAYQDLEDELVRLGKPRSRYRDSSLGSYFETVEISAGRRDRLWSDVEEVRRTNPGAFKDVPATRAEFETWAAGRRGARARDQSVAARGPTGSAVVPALAFGLTRMTTAENLPFLFLGGTGRTAAGTVLRQFGAGVQGAAVMAPQVAMGRIEMGEGYSSDELLTDLAIGGAVQGTFAAAPYAATRAGKLAYEQLPLDYRMARALAQAVPEHTRPPELAAAIHVAERAGEIDGSSPYQFTVAALDAHTERLEATIARLADLPRAAPPRMAVAAAPAPAAAPQPTSTGLAGGGFDMQRYMGRSRSAESSGNDAAAAATSSAYGRYQFLKDTWLTTYRQTFGNTGESADAILRKRADGAVQDRVMQTFTQNNVNGLRRAGVPVTDGTVYLAHFLGLGDAIKVLRAAPDAALGGVVRPASVAANRAVFDKLGSTSELIAWAERKMGRAAQGTPAAAIPEMPPAPIVRPEAMDAVRPLVTAAGRELPVASFAPGEIDVDAPLMQFKAGGDAQGVTERLRGVETWDPISAGMVTVWESADGRRLIADGHQRLSLARRIQAADPAQDIQLNAFVLREADGFMAADARVLTALKNIREGSGSATDAAKVFREAGLDEDLLRTLPPRSALIRDGKALARLSDEAFGAVINEVISENHAAAIGHLAPDPASHMALVDLLTQIDPPNRMQAEAVVRQALDAGFVRETQEELFGSRDVATALFAQKARALDRTMAELRKMKSAFGVAARNAEALDAAGNRIDVGASTAAGDANARALALIDALALRKGNAVNDLFNAAAARLAQGERIDRVVKDLVERLGKLDLEQVARGSDGPGGPAGGSGRDGFTDGEAAGDQSPELTPATRDELEAAGQGGFALFDEPAHQAFDDPAGAGAQSAAASIWHDIRAAEEITSKASAAAASAPEPATKEIGPLIDLDDGKGPRSIAEIEAELTAQEAGIDAIRNCL